MKPSLSAVLALSLCVGAFADTPSPAQIGPAQGGKVLGSIHNQRHQINPADLYDNPGNHHDNNTLTSGAVLGIHAKSYFPYGHAWISLQYNGEAQTYGLWRKSDNEYDDRVHPDSDVRLGRELRKWNQRITGCWNRFYKLTPDQLARLQTFIITPKDWTCWHNCSLWARDAVFEATGEEIPLRDLWNGFWPSPRGLIRSIKKLEKHYSSRAVDSRAGEDEMACSDDSAKCDGSFDVVCCGGDDCYVCIDELECGYCQSGSLRCIYQVSKVKNKANLCGMVCDTCPYVRGDLVCTHECGSTEDCADRLKGFNACPNGAACKVSADLVGCDAPPRNCKRCRDGSGNFCDYMIDSITNGENCGFDIGDTVCVSCPGGDGCPQTIIWVLLDEKGNPKCRGTWRRLGDGTCRACPPGGKKGFNFRGF